MSNTATSTFLYTLEIELPKSPGGSYQWVIRKNGKLAQRSDRNHPTEAKAREKGLMVWTPPMASVCQSEGVEDHSRRPPWTR